MDGLQITVLVMGAMIFIVSFLIPGGKGRKATSDDAAAMTEDQVKYMVEKEIEDAKQHINDIIDETITYSMEKTERSMDRITNEKMLAINEYSDTVLNEINKNQQEVVFLYDMLNDKHETLKNTVSQAAVTASEVKQTVRDAEVTAKEAEEAAKAVRDQLFTPFHPERVESIQQERMEGVSPETFMDRSAGAYAGTSPEDFIDRSSGAYTGTSSEVSAVTSAGSSPGTPSGDFADLSDDTNSVTVADRNTDAFGDVSGNAQSDSPINTPEQLPSHQVSPPKQAKNARKTKSAPVIAGDADKAESADIAPREMEILFKGSRTGGRNNNERILGLHKAGKSNMAIAKDLGLGIGEVKLVIDLFEGTN